jgi:hypothetical protein
MCRRLPFAAAGLLLLLPAPGGATPPARASADPVPPLGAGSARVLAGALRAALLQMLPSPLYQASPGWGETREFKTGLKLTGRGLQTRLESVWSPRNHGRWRKVSLTALNLPDSLAFDLRDLRQPAPDRLAFTVVLALDVRADIEQQRWQAGTRLYATDVRARLRAKLKLDCEAEVVLNSKDGALPDLVCRLRVTRADVDYDNLVVEHVGGVGGTPARLLGEAVRSGVRRFAPDVERGLLDRAGAAVARAAGTREVCVSLDRLVKGFVDRQNPPGQK